MKAAPLNLEYLHTLPLSEALERAGSLLQTSDLRLKASQMLIARMQIEDDENVSSKIIRTLCMYCEPDSAITNELLSLLYCGGSFTVHVIEALALLCGDDMQQIESIFEGLKSMIELDRRYLVPCIGALGELPLNDAQKHDAIRIATDAMSVVEESDLPAAARMLLRTMTKQSGAMVVNALRRECASISQGTLSLIVEVIENSLTANHFAGTLFLDSLRTSSQISRLDVLIGVYLLGNPRFRESASNAWISAARTGTLNVKGIECGVLSKHKTELVTLCLLLLEDIGKKREFTNLSEISLLNTLDVTKELSRLTFERVSASRSPLLTAILSLCTRTEQWMIKSETDTADSIRAVLPTSLYESSNDFCFVPSGSEDSFIDLALSNINNGGKQPNWCTTSLVSPIALASIKIVRYIVESNTSDVAKISHLLLEGLHHAHSYNIITFRYLCDCIAMISKINDDIVSSVMVFIQKELFASRNSMIQYGLAAASAMYRISRLNSNDFYMVIGWCKEYIKREIEGLGKHPCPFPLSWNMKAPSIDFIHGLDFMSSIVNDLSSEVAQGLFVDIVCVVVSRLGLFQNVLRKVSVSLENGQRVHKFWEFFGASDPFNYQFPGTDISIAEHTILYTSLCTRTFLRFILRLYPQFASMCQKEIINGEKGPLSTLMTYTVACTLLDVFDHDIVEEKSIITMLELRNEVSKHELSRFVPYSNIDSFVCVKFLKECRSPLNVLLPLSEMVITRIQNGLLYPLNEIQKDSTGGGSSAVKSNLMFTAGKWEEELVNNKLIDYVYSLLDLSRKERLGFNNKRAKLDGVVTRTNMKNSSSAVVVAGRLAAILLGVMERNIGNELGLNEVTDVTMKDSICKSLNLCQDKCLAMILLKIISHLGDGSSTSTYFMDALAMVWTDAEAMLLPLVPALEASGLRLKASDSFYFVAWCILRALFSADNTVDVICTVVSVLEELMVSDSDSGDVKKKRKISESDYHHHFQCINIHHTISLLRLALTVVSSSFQVEIIPGNSSCYSGGEEEKVSEEKEKGISLETKTPNQVINTLSSPYGKVIDHCMIIQRLINLIAVFSCERNRSITTSVTMFLRKVITMIPRVLKQCCTFHTTWSNSYDNYDGLDALSLVFGHGRDLVSRIVRLVDVLKGDGLAKKHVAILTKSAISSQLWISETIQDFHMSNVEQICRPKEGHVDIHGFIKHGLLDGMFVSSGNNSSGVNGKRKAKITGDGSYAVFKHYIQATMRRGATEIMHSDPSESGDSVSSGEEREYINGFGVVNNSDADNDSDEEEVIVVKPSK